MPIAAGIGSGVGNIGGAIIGGKATKDAAQMQADAANRATQMQWDMYQQQRSDLAPWRQSGAKALSDLANPDFQRDFTSSDFQQDPGYQFRMQEGQKALERSAAARGGLMSGGFGKALNRYNQDYASNEFQRARDNFNNDRTTRFNRLSSIAGLGQTANGQVGQAGMNYANNAGSNIMGAANAGGAAAIANANLWGNSLSGLGRAGMDLYAIDKYSQRPPASPPSWYGQNLSSLATNNPDYFNGSYDNVSNFGKR